MSKFLSFFLVTAAIFLVLVVSADSLPSRLSANLFHSAVVISAGLTIAYFYFREWGRKGSTYYQPVSLVDADVSGGALNQLRLRFYNSEYAKIFTQANPELILSGFLKVEVHGTPSG